MDQPHQKWARLLKGKYVLGLVFLAVLQSPSVVFGNDQIIEGVLLRRYASALKVDTIFA